ncbi:MULTISPECIES: hypothetical protein [unclassified Xanthobacter]|uniref:hypothetical protein n=1 Tax=unclassified Xanthobacter TaxID=2623496 RepID=UPI001F456017|nr:MULTISPECIES: hypothetical protein [unclassified Xanthobacter]
MGNMSWVMPMLAAALVALGGRGALLLWSSPEGAFLRSLYRERAFAAALYRAHARSN